jgi:bacterioferritin-associated ferredoxin
MFICNCNALNEARVCAAVLSGASTVSEVHERCGAVERCGGCGPQICEVIGRVADAAGADAKEASYAA